MLRQSWIFPFETFGLSDVFVVTVIARNIINGSSDIVTVNELRLRHVDVNCYTVKKRFCVQNWFLFCIIYLIVYWLNFANTKVDAKNVAGSAPEWNNQTSSACAQWCIRLSHKPSFGRKFGPTNKRVHKKLGKLHFHDCCEVNL